MPPPAHFMCKPYTDTLSTANTESDLLPDADMSEGLLSGVLHACHVDSGAAGDDPIQLENFKVLGSYNWIDARLPTKLVPGSPPGWRDRPRPLPFRVPDSGFQVFDPNGYYMGFASTLIPLYRVEDHADTSMDWGAVDFVIDRSSLRKILRWVRGASASADVAASSNTNTNANANTKWNTNWKQTHVANTTTNNAPLPAYSKSRAQRKLWGAGAAPDFRLGLQLAGKKTILVERWDTRTCQELLPGAHGCKNNFDEAATSPARGPKSTKYHNRMVQYDLEGVRPVVRFEADACILSEDDAAGPPKRPVCLVLAVTTRPLTPSSSHRLLRHKPRRHLAHKWRETYTQFLLSQTVYSFLAVHQNGQFSAAEKHARRDSPVFKRFDTDAHTQRDLC
ncbi:hypothetical protein C8Q79DRAFT_1012881 [Trametes meyenii]|nr:hypothetical protein C8Q79DRAFT_1012881 [Trametes meyenii]